MYNVHRPYPGLNQLLAQNTNYWCSKLGTEHNNHPPTDSLPNIFNTHLKIARRPPGYYGGMEVGSMDAVYVAGVQRCKSQEVSMSAPCYPCPRPDIRWCPCQGVRCRLASCRSRSPELLQMVSHPPSSPSAPSINSAWSVNQSCFTVPREGPYKVLSAEIITDRRFGQQRFLKPPVVDSSSSYSKQSGEFKQQCEYKRSRYGGGRRRYGGGRCWCWCVWWQGAARCGLLMQTADTLDTGDWPPATATSTQHPDLNRYHSIQGWTGPAFTISM